MAKPALSFDEASLHGMPAGEMNRVSRAAPKPSYKAGRPKFPKDDLPANALDAWKNLVKELARRRTLTPGDGPQLTLYVRTFLQWKLACADIEKNGVMVDEERFSKDGNPYTVHAVNPAVKVAQGLCSELKDSLKEMGLTGLARDKVSPVAKEDTKPAAVPGTLAYFQKNAESEKDSAPELVIEDGPEETENEDVTGTA